MRVAGTALVLSLGLAASIMAAPAELRRVTLQSQPGYLVQTTCSGTESGVATYLPLSNSVSGFCLLVDSADPRYAAYHSYKYSGGEGGETVGSSVNITISVFSDSSCSISAAAPSTLLLHTNCSSGVAYSTANSFPALSSSAAVEVGFGQSSCSQSTLQYLKYIPAAVEGACLSAAVSGLGSDAMLFSCGVVGLGTQLRYSWLKFTTTTGTCSGPYSQVTLTEPVSCSPSSNIYTKLQCNYQAVSLPPSPQPTAQPISDPASSSSSASCFSGLDTVLLESGETLALQDVTVGDRTLSVSSNGVFKFSEVIAMPHSRNSLPATFLSISLMNGLHISPTPDHILIGGACDGEVSAILASKVTMGMCLRTIHGDSVVADIISFQGRGAYTAVTLEEYIVVNGVVASPFAFNHFAGNLWYAVPRLITKSLPESLWKSALIDSFQTLGVRLLTLLSI